MSDQCEHSGPQGQCHNPSADGSDKCAKHSKEKDRIQSYRLKGQLRERFEHFSSASLLKTVRDEIVLLQSLIEDRLDLADSPAERLVAFQAVRPALVDVVKCFETLTKLEAQTSVTLGKEALSELGKEVIQILTEELKDVPNYDTIIDSVAAKMAASISNARNQ